MTTIGKADPMLRIRLIEPPAPSVHMWSYAHYPRLGLPIIGAALRAAGHDVRIYARPLTDADRQDVLAADLVGISTTTSTAPAAYTIADALRARRVPTVLGGSHVTFLTDEALGHTDYVARGEGGDALMLELIDALAGRRDLESIPGLSFNHGGEHIHNEDRLRSEDLDDVPVPDLSLIVGNGSAATTPIMTSWGCPFACNFCSVTATFGRKVRRRSVDNVIAELRAKRPRSISFYDDNFAGDKAGLKQLLSAMIEQGLTVPWQAQVRTDVVRDTELLDLMRRSGCRTLALGLESVNQATLDGFEKAQTVADVATAIDTLHDSHIDVHGMFVVGADSDTAATADETVDFALQHHIDTLMLNVLTPAPGTLQFERMDAEGRIFDKSWRVYDGQHVVFTPAQMTPAELQRTVLRGYRRFFSSRRWLARAAEERFRRFAVDSWCWWYARSWYTDARNRAHLRKLDELSRRAAGRWAGAAGSKGTAA